uniref:C3H1-type domain-containing protein n=1 Tax=Micromonas pusilla TaxID=38833 RepID=A0A7S0KF00_MICPS|mmetsp:Transcript_12633/g.49179  ORF Transcript_12633/g.49179 Transcript_12633/m.49179 type:complete len:497 (+) Transcript_12633:236-1726(+)
MAAAAGRPEVCRDFLKGACFRDNCRYAHSSQDGSQPAAQANQPICRDFQNGRCFRASCRFYHGTAAELAAAQAAAAVGVSAATFAALGGQQLLMPQVDGINALQRAMSLPVNVQHSSSFDGHNSYDAQLLSSLDPTTAAALLAASGNGFHSWNGTQNGVSSPLGGNTSAAAAAAALLAAAGGSPSGAGNIASLLAMQSAQLQQQQNKANGADTTGQWVAIQQQLQQLQQQQQQQQGNNGVPAPGLLSRSLGDHSKLNGYINGNGHLNGHGNDHTNGGFDAARRASVDIGAMSTLANGAAKMEVFNSIINGRSSLDLGADLRHGVNGNGHINGGHPIKDNGNGHINGGYPINGNGSSNGLANGGSLSSTGGLWSFDGEGGSPLTSRRTSFDPGSRRTSMGDVGVGRSRLSLDGIGGGYGGLWSEDRSGVLNRGSPRQSLSLDILPEHVSNNNGIPAKLTSGLSVNGGTIGSSFGAGDESKLPATLMEQPAKGNYSLF